ncbi:MAG TPA: hypothetical protein VM599_01715 [Thermoanaerobaculia bacterium]|nr:hypothetical protein [Thermoanaerobaculia bacterium]
MARDFETTVTGWYLLAAAVLGWLTWTLLPHHLGTYLEAGDFAAVAASFRPWIWLFRGYFFAQMVTVMALIALAMVLGRSRGRIFAWPGAVVATLGIAVGAVGAAFYYHHGAWGAEHLAGRPPEEAAAFLAAILYDTELITCLTRFARVFFGLGQLVLAVGLWLSDGLVPRWLAAAGGLLGIAAMALTMALPDALDLYAPIFHANALWLAALGVALLRSRPAAAA